MKEIEQKFIVTLPIEEVRRQIDAVVRSAGLTQDSWYQSSRLFAYYDTPHLDLLRTGQTLRQVSGFPKGVRYDLKSGPIVDRNESSIWAEGPDIAPMFQALGGVPVLQDMPMYYNKCLVHRGNTIIECGIDQTPYYTEVEFELESGSREELDKFCETFHSVGGFAAADVQKYLRTWIMQHEQLRNLQHVQQNCRWHSDTVLEHTLQAVQELQQVLEEFPTAHGYELFLATAFHDVGKIDPQLIDGQTKFPGHEKKGASMVELSSEDLLPGQELHIRQLIADHGYLHKVLLNGKDTHMPHLNAQARLSLADLRASNLGRVFPEEYANREHKLISTLNNREEKNDG